MNAVRAPERRQLTVMLCDLVGWTALSQRVDAEELTEVVQAYRKRCTELIASHGGVVAQYVGDAVLAYFGYPRAHEDDAERAMRAALAIVGAKSGSSEDVRSEVHIGIATGMVVVGDLTTDSAVTQAGGKNLSGETISAVGSALNLASRLQGLAEAGMIVASDQTRRLAGAMFEYRDLGSHTLKGFDTPVQAWQVVGEASVRSRFRALRAPQMTPLVDRCTELETLKGVWADVQAGHGRAVLLSGEPGVGKSRFTEVLARHVVDRRCQRLWYYCSPHLQSSPLVPLVRQLAVDAGLAETDDDATKLEKLARSLPKGIDNASEVVALLADLLSIDYESKYPALQMSPQRKKQRLFQGLTQVLEALAKRRPVMLVVEDLHWIDPSSDELIGVLIDRLKDIPLLVVLTARPEFEPPWQDSAHILQVPLNPLERNDSIAMIELLCRERQIPTETISRIADQTDGLPLFIEDLTRDMFEVEDLRGAGVEAASRAGPLAFSIPTTLSDSLMARLDRLGSAKRIAQIGASIGRDFSHELLAMVADVPEEELKEQLHRLVETGLLLRLRTGSVRGYRFKHALIRDAAYSSLLKKEQVALHARIADTLAKEFPDLCEAQPEVLAQHFEGAKNVGEAVHYLIRAASLSAKRSGFVEAIRQLEHGLALLEALPADLARTQLQLQVYLALGAINAEHRGFSAAACGAAYTKALELCRELGDTPDLFTVLSGVGSFEITRANFARCRALAEECLSRAVQQSSKPPLVMGHRLLGGTLFLMGEFVDAQKHLNEAISIYDQDQSLCRSTQAVYVQDHKSTGLCYLALTLTLMGHLKDGLRAAEDSVAHSRALGYPHSINFSLCYLAAALHFRRDARAAFACATESLELAREQGFATWIGTSLMIRGASWVSDGASEAGMKEIAAGRQAHAGMEATAYQPFGISLLVEGLLAVNKVDDALAALEQGIAIGERIGERFYLAELLRQKGEVLARCNRKSEAEEALYAAIELSRKQSARLLELRSATSLCRLLTGPCRVQALDEVLLPVYDWFQDGAECRDLVDAAIVLGKVKSSEVER